MPRTVVPVDFDDKDSMKGQIEFFIGQKASRKVEVTKVGAGYKVLFTTEDPPPPAGVA